MKQWLYFQHCSHLQIYYFFICFFEIKLYSERGWPEENVVWRGKVNFEQVSNFLTNPHTNGERS